MKNRFLSILVLVSMIISMTSSPAMAGGTGAASKVATFDKSNNSIKVTDPHVAATGITGVPTAATAGVALQLNGTVAPSTATNQAILWSITNAGTTGATISENTLSATAAGTAKITATITNGLTATTNYTQDFDIIVGVAAPIHVPVTKITGVPTVATVGTALQLSGTVAPSTATNKTIVWSVASAGTTGATISGYTLNTTAEGTAKITATITNGSTTRNYTQDFTINVSAATRKHVPVTGITGVLSTAEAGATLVLGGTVAPITATNKTTVWSVASAGTTGATISGNKLTTTAAGTATITATITNGLTATTNYTQNFDITVRAASPAADPDLAIIEMAKMLIIDGTVSVPSEADQTAKTAAVQNYVNQKLTGNVASVTAVVTHTSSDTYNVVFSCNNATGSKDITVAADVAPYTAVLNITDVPTDATAETELMLSGTVTPSNASYQTIVWSVASEGETGAAISGNALSTTAAGTATITATIKNGFTTTEDYTQNFDIIVGVAAPIHVPVTKITDVPTAATVGTALPLSGMVVPIDATNQTIVWSVASEGKTGATISGNALSTTATGTATITATITNGLTATEDYTQNFDIIVGVSAPIHIPVTKITGVPTAATVGTALPLSGTVAPTNATNQAILWSVASEGETGATISGNKLTTTAAGTATITATITNGASASTNYTESFTIQVSNPHASESTGDEKRETIIQTPAGDLIDSVVGSTTGKTAITEAIKAAEGKSSVTAYVNFANYTAVTKETLQAISKAISEEAEKNKKQTIKTKVEFDNVDSAFVLSRITVDAAKLAEIAPDRLDLGVSYDQNKDTKVKEVVGLFEKFFNNKIIAIAFEQKTPLAVNVEVATKLDTTGLDTKKLYFYSYNSLTNLYTPIIKPNCWVDKNGYTHFTAPFGGSTIITSTPLTLKNADTAK